MTKETEHVFRSDGAMQPPSTSKANKALYAFIKSQASQDLINVLEQMDTQDGLEAYLMIERRCCPQDSQAKKTAYHKLFFSRINIDEPIKSFNKRWNRLLFVAQTNGVGFDEEFEQVDIYLEGVRPISNPQVALTLLDLRRQHDAWMSGTRYMPYPRNLKIAEIQGLLEREEECSTEYLQLARKYDPEQSF